ncbi:MAG: hypothetical protein PHE80_03010 [Candidatus Omnitrophica bacterium]|nr:hypothetical protein [Candidatus Omnitrophota bacterium]MDD5737350.1 hypothetical protein [Candidatus Omnitrophota bacterium]
MKKAYTELRKNYNEVKHSYSEMIMRLALIAELKDGSTGTHLVKVAEYCTEIARKRWTSSRRRAGHISIRR